MDVTVYNMQGAEVGTLKINEADLGGVVKPALIKQAYVRYHANLRQGSARTRSRHAVEGSTRKIYKQKGTGRARHGDKQAPIFRGGGHTFAKTRGREAFRQDMPKKMRRLANRNALLAKLVDAFWLIPSKELAAEIAKAEARFGLTPYDRHRMDWKIEQPTVRPKAPPTRKGPDPREMFRVVR